MPWQDNSGNRGPWGQPPRGGNGGNHNNGGRGKGEPPDLEDLLEASRQRLRRAFPKGRGGGNGGAGPQLNKSVFALGGAVILALWAFSGVYTVKTDELAVVTTFGKFSKVTGPGLHWHIPSPIQALEKEDVLNLKTMALPAADRRAGTLSPGLMLTGNKNIVDVAFTVQWKIKAGIIADTGQDLPGVAQFVFNIDGPEELIRTVGEASMREVVGRNTLDYVQTDGRLEVQRETQELMQTALDEYESGIQIDEVLLSGAEPPTDAVNEAFRDVQAAEQNQATVIQQARRYTNEKVPEARGQAQRILEEAGAYAARVTAEARGDANRFEQIYAEYAKAPEVTRQRMYLETVESVLGPMNKVIIDEDGGQGVVPYLPLNELNKNNRGDQ